MRTEMDKHYIVTGGAGFIGSAFVMRTRKYGIPVINIDKLTYCGNLENLISLKGDSGHTFIHGDICNEELLTYLFDFYHPSAIVNFAAESHVDRSIYDPDTFIRTNVQGTCILLRVAYNYWKKLSAPEKQQFRFLHISTDEVFGSLATTDLAFTEKTPYAPSSPYSASKAASDHLVRAFHITYGLPILITNCSNNYGPRQFPEKLIPFMFCCAMDHKYMPIYGNGKNIRDWLYVDDHCEAISLVLEKGIVGHSYNIGGKSERSNIEVVNSICKILDDINPWEGRAYSSLIKYVKDRPGHDLRYAMDCSYIESSLGWKPAHSFEEGLRETIYWYLKNKTWIENIKNRNYKTWLDKNYKYR